MDRSKDSKQSAPQDPDERETLMRRRTFLQQGALAGAAALVSPSGPAEAQTAPALPGAAAAQAGPPPVMTQAAEATPPGDVQVMGDNERSGSDFMVDVLKSLNFDYICANPGSSFRGLHESFINYGGNQSPELLTCTHEESSVAMAHAYFKAEGKPLAVMAHGTVGLQHASMALYNAWCDRVPVYLILGNHSDAAIRRAAERYHGVQDAAAMVRDYTKWDDTPWSLTHFAESAVRAYKIALTPPMAPVVLVLDGGLQEHPIEKSERLSIPKLTMPSPPQGETAAVEEAARMLVAAQSPLLVADRLARTPKGMTLLIELAEALQAGVIDQGGRMNFPSRHPLNQGQRAAAAVADADVIVGLEVSDFWATVNSLRDQLHRTTRPLTRPTAKMITITTGDLYIRANYQDFRRMQEVDLAIAADGEATLPSLIEAVKRLTTGDRRRVFQERGAKLADASRAAAERTRVAASYAWDASPVSTARLCAEVWGQIKNEDWSLVSSYYSPDTGGWARRLWDFNKSVSVARPCRRRWHRLRRTRIGGRRARQPASRAPLGGDSNRRRSPVRPRRALDGCAPQDSAPERDAQQPRVPHGGDARAAHVQCTQPWRRSRQPGQRDRRAQYRLRENGAIDGRLRRRPNLGREGTRPRAQPRDRRRQARRTGARRCRDTSTVRKR